MQMTTDSCSPWQPGCYLELIVDGTSSQKASRCCIFQEKHSVHEFAPSCVQAQGSVQDLGVALEDALLFFIYWDNNNNNNNSNVNVTFLLVNVRHRSYGVMFSSDAFWRFALNRNNSVNVLRMKSKKILLALQWRTLNTPLPSMPAHIQTALLLL